jgi:hypothetical protein
MPSSLTASLPSHGWEESYGTSCFGDDSAGIRFFSHEFIDIAFTQPALSSEH